MKAFLAAFLLALSLYASPVMANNLTINTIGSEEYISKEDFNLAVGLALKHYGGYALNQGLKVGTARPIDVYFVSAFYGAYLREVGIVINVDPILKDNESEEDRRKQFIYVVAHELGHHILNDAGVDIEDQHKHMYCNVDPVVAEEVGYELNMLMVFMFCAG